MTMHSNTPAPETVGTRSIEPLRDIIWNTTAICGWNCATCCVAAVHVTQRGGQVLISSPELDRHDAVADDGSGGNPYDRALRYRQRNGLELTLEQKLTVLDHLSGHRIRLDISGGDALSPRENYLLLEAAAKQFGRDAVTLTATGAGLAGYDIPTVVANIAELNFTFDGEPDPADPLRPSTYATSNLGRARKFAQAGVSTRAECPLSAQNLAPGQLTVIYRQLHEAGIDKLLLMRLFPVGRGEMVPGAIPTNEQYKQAIATLRALEARYGTPKVKLQCALRLLEGPTKSNPCDALTESFGLMWDGTLLGSPWAINKSGKPVDAAWVLGNLATTSLTEILATEKVRRMQGRAGENHGHCKIFSWLNGTAQESEDRIFQGTDPMYADITETARGAA
jgi:MoaA/NifB/PqqE/SkfB family radical SAM enzyme